MKKTPASSVESYLASLPEDRREAIQAVRKVILKNLDKNFQETIEYGMIGYSVPHSVYPAGYHCDPRQPLPYVGIASQKNHMAVYLFCVYCQPGGERSFRDAWAKTGKKLDMGKSCVRFQKLDDVALDVIGETIRRTPAKEFIRTYEANLPGAAKRAAKPKPSRGRARAAKGVSKASKEPSKASPKRAASKAGK